MRGSRLAGLALGACAAACATLAADGRGDVDLPDAHDGPFRVLKRTESCTGDVCTGVDELPPGTPDGLAKYPGVPASRAPAVLVRGSGEGNDLRTIVYAARDLDAPPARIVRLEAADSRDFKDVAEVLTGDAPFEAGAIGDPSALDVGGEVWLYYSIHPRKDAPAQLAGIARARSTDGASGRSFVKDDAPLFTADGVKGSWETEPPRAPSVLRLPDGTFRMFYASGVAIGEASSADGVHFTRLDADPSTPELDPVVVPSAPVDASALPPGVKPPFDDLAVDDPSVARVVSEVGRVLYRLHYTGRDRRTGSAIGLAGRFGDRGSFSRSPGPVYGGRSNPHVNAPTVARFPAFSLIYCDVDFESGQALGVGVAPASVKLRIVE